MKLLIFIFFIKLEKYKNKEKNVVVSVAQW